MKTSFKTIIIGGGVTGMMCAHELHKKGERDFLVVTKDIGGRVITSKDNTQCGNAGCVSELCVSDKGSYRHVPFGFAAQTITIKEIAEIIADTLKFQNRVIFDTSKPTGQVKRTVSGNKLKSLYPEFRFTSIENGIRETVDWFVSNYGTARI